MKTLRSYVEGRWYEAPSGFVALIDPCSEEPIAQASSAGLDFGAALEFAVKRGGPALRELTIGQRANVLMEMSKALHGHRDELITLSLENTGTTRRDSKFDVDGAIFTLAHYARLGEELGDGEVLVATEETDEIETPAEEDDPLQLLQAENAELKEARLRLAADFPEAPATAICPCLPQSCPARRSPSGGAGLRQDPT